MRVENLLTSKMFVNSRMAQESHYEIHLYVKLLQLEVENWTKAGWIKASAT